MQVVYERCCGLDVHKKTVVACLITLTAQGQRHKEIRTFGTMTRDLLALLDWLRAAGCTHVAFESTGVYWRPIFNQGVRQRGSCPSRLGHRKRLY
jgi:transposase